MLAGCRGAKTSIVSAPFRFISDHPLGVGGVSWRGVVAGCRGARTDAGTKNKRHLIITGGSRGRKLTSMFDAVNSFAYTALFNTLSGHTSSS